MVLDLAGKRPLNDPDGYQIALLQVLRDIKFCCESATREDSDQLAVQSDLAPRFYTVKSKENLIHQRLIGVRADFAIVRIH